MIHYLKWSQHIQTQPRYVPGKPFPFQFLDSNVRTYHERDKHIIRVCSWGGSIICYDNPNNNSDQPTKFLLLTGSPSQMSCHVTKIKLQHQQIYKSSSWSNILTFFILISGHLKKNTMFKSNTSNLRNC